MALWHFRATARFKKHFILPIYEKYLIVIILRLPIVDFTATRVCRLAVIC